MTGRAEPLPTIVLASASVRRRELLAQLGITPVVLAPNVDERLDPRLSPAENAEALARTKAASALAAAPPGSLLLAADTLVTLDGAILGKPRDEVDARRMLQRLSGREHQVCTGICIQVVGGEGSYTGHEITDVRFRKIPGAEIEAYLRSPEPWDKAGAYAIQGRAALFAEGIRGDYSNVVGLPLGLTARLLAEALGQRDLVFLLDIE